MRKGVLLEFLEPPISAFDFDHLVCFLVFACNHWSQHVYLIYMLKCVCYKYMWRTKLHIFVDKLYLLVGNLPCCEKIRYKVYGSNFGLNCSDTQPDHLAAPNLSSCAPSTIAAPCTVRLKSALVKLAVETHMRSIIASVERFSEYLNLHNCTSSSHQRDELCSWHGSARK